MRYLLALLLAAMTTSVRADDGVDISSAGQVSDLLAVQENLDAVSAAIMGCLDTGKEHAECMCAHLDLIEHFNASVRKVFTDHPGLGEYDIVRFKSPDGTWISQSLEGLRQQAGTTTVCN